MTRVANRLGTSFSSEGWFAFVGSQLWTVSGFIGMSLHCRCDTALVTFCSIFLARGTKYVPFTFGRIFLSTGKSTRCTYHWTLPQKWN